MQTREVTGLDGALDLRVGDVVEVRSADEILATLDENGEFESLPFMPEMFQYCGRRLTVYRSAHKLCDTLTRSGMRRMHNAVHLTGARCDGQAHGGCQASCMIFWKTVWLKRVDGPVPRQREAAVQRDPVSPPDGTRLLPVIVAASRAEPAADGTEVFRCQATEMARAAPEVLPVRDLSQYVRDVRSGNAGFWWVFRSFLVAFFNRVQDISSHRLPRWLQFRHGLRWGFLKGTATTRTPTGQIDLRPGELVRVRTRDEIMGTLNADLLNRGMGFDVEMARFCGRTARVARRIEHIVDERTGRMIYMRHPCIVLDGIVCEGAFSMNCPRAITAYWREVWLERVEEPST